jgi:NAD(P)-dependent dehydrogenase (short-subunit alcohol dehydrogenase family)
VVLASRDPEKGEAAAAALRGEGLDVTPHPLDVTDPGSIDGSRASSSGSSAGSTSSSNNAGVFKDSSGGEPEGASALRSDPAIVRRTFETNTLGPLMVSQALIPLMQGSGRVVNVSSGMGSSRR